MGRNRVIRNFMKIILYQPDMAGNLGAVMRSCACFGIELEVIEPCGFPLTAKAIRKAAMDYGAPEALKRHKSWEQFEKSDDLGRLVLFTTKGASALTDFAFRPDDRLLFGRESKPGSKPFAMRFARSSRP